MLCEERHAQNNITETSEKRMRPKSIILTLAKRKIIFNLKSLQNKNLILWLLLKLISKIIGRLLVLLQI